MRKYIITLINKATLGGFSYGFDDAILYQDLELESYITDKDFRELQESYSKTNFYILAITDVTGEK